MSETNYEHYKEQIIEAMTRKGVCWFNMKFRMNTQKASCGGYVDDCRECRKELKAWLNEEYKAPAVYWTQVAVDTPILVSSNGKDWYNRYFSHYENDCVFAWNDGCTSWSATTFVSWKYAKLANEGE